MTEYSDIPEGYKATKLGVLPEEWNIVNVSEVIQKTSNLNPKKNPNYEFDYIDVSSVSSHNLTIQNTTHCIAYSCPSRARKIVEENDVIFATVRPSLRRISLVPKKLNNQICSTAFCVLRPDPNKIDPSFLFFAVSYEDFVNRISEHQRGVAYPAITDKEILEEIIPLPPLPEQHAIATTLRTVQEAKERTDAVITATKTLKAAMMKHLFTYGPVPREEAERVALKETEIGQVPEGWEVVKLGEISEFLQYGTSKKCDYDMKGYPVLRIPNIVNGIIDSTDLKFLYTTIEDFNKIQLKIGDVLFVRTNGVRNLVGRCAIYQGEPENSLFASYLIRVRLKSDRALPDFVQYYAETPCGREFLSGQASGSADGKFNINTQTIKSVILPLPDVTIQKRIVDIISSIDQKLAAEQSRKEALDTLFTTLLHDLMTAKIRINPEKPAV